MVFCARFTCLSVICLSTYSVFKKKKKRYRVLVSLFANIIVTGFPGNKILV